MRILLLAPQDRTTLGIIAGYCQSALSGLGHEVKTFDFRSRPYPGSKYLGGLKKLLRKALPQAPSPYDFPAIRSGVDSRINRMLLELAVSFKPEIVLVFCGENISVESLQRMRRELNAVTVHWMLDTLLLPYRVELLKGAAQAYDQVFLVDSQEILKNIGINFNHVSTLALACEPSVHKKIELSREDKDYYGSDVAFVGTVTPERQVWLEQLSSFNLKIWGRWQKPGASLKKCYRQKDVYSEEAVKIYNASKIVLDFHSLWGKERVLYNVTPRVFEVPACGGFLLTCPSLQLEDFYRSGEEMIVYKDIQDLKRMIRHYLGHPQERQAIAEKAFRRAHSEHTYGNRLKKLLDTVIRGQKV